MKQDLSHDPAEADRPVRSFCDYIIIGGTGDLSVRKIFPALLVLFLNRHIRPGDRLIACSRSATEKDAFAATLRPFCEAHLRSLSAPVALTDDSWRQFLELLYVVQLDVVKGSGFKKLLLLLSSGQEEQAPPRLNVIYLALSPGLFEPACRALARAKLRNTQSRLVIEKPFGHDLASAQEINTHLTQRFDDAMIYRIDHYLGKESVQNLMALRFANTIFEWQWSNLYVDHIQITVAEQVGVEQRASFYDRYGVLRDMVQNHLLQLLCLVAMEPPSHYSPHTVRDEKLRVLEALNPVNAANFSDFVVTGQYTEGTLDREQVPAYAEEVGQSSSTPTFVALKIGINNARWAGTPFYLRTGKRMAVRASEIIVTFKKNPHKVFDLASKNALPNQLIIRLQPEDGLQLLLNSKRRGGGSLDLRPVKLNLLFDQASEVSLGAYERLLMDVVEGNQTLFMRYDELEAAWRWIDPIIQASQKAPPEPYRAGTMGPSGAVRLMAEDKRQWIDPNG